VEIAAALVADLALLSEALDEPEADVVESLRSLVADVRSSVGSYLGLTLTVTGSEPPLTITALEDDADPADVAASIRVPLDVGGADIQISLVLYATTPGAFVDLAADLSWLTGRDLGDFALDRHVIGPDKLDGADGLGAASVINQAIGVLIGRGHTPSQARRELNSRATAAGTERHIAAAEILRAPGDLDLAGEV
jgi:hypothetical protein